MTCPKCSFQNPESELTCRQCQTGLPPVGPSVSSTSFNQPTPARRFPVVFGFIGGVTMLIIAVIIAVWSYFLKNQQQRNISSPLLPTTGVTTRTSIKDMPASTGNDCISDEVYKKFGELLSQDLERFPGTETFETTVSPGPLPVDFPSQLSLHPAMKLCWVSKASPDFGKDIAEGFNFIGYSILFSVNTDLTEIADWYQNQFLNQGLSVSDDTEVSKSLRQYNADKFKQAGVDTFDLVKVITVTIPKRAEAFPIPIKASVIFIRINGVPGVQISYANIEQE